MRPILILSFVLFASAVLGQSALDKALHTMFPSTKPKVLVKPKPKHKPAKKAQAAEIAPTPDPLHRKVEPEWMARYWEQEALWDYYIPEDRQIRFKDGQYIVPIVVYRHYEDMSATAKRSDR